MPAHGVAWWVVGMAHSVFLSRFHQRFVGRCMHALTLGDFILERPLARGGMGEVWRAHHRSGIPVAVKVLASSKAHRRLWFEGLHAEIRAVAGLDHPHIVWIHDAGMVERAEAEESGGKLVAGSPWFAMELADGGTLREHRPRTWTELRALLVALLQALAHAHARGIVHRDIKPANVLFAGDTPKLSDFGMVFSVDPGREEGPTGGGTPAYMAPEQFEGERWDLGPWTDLYALGCLAYTLVCGRHPYPGKSWVRLFNAHWNMPIPAMQPKFPVPPAFEDWIRHAMAKSRHDRFQRAADAHRALLDLEDSSRVIARPAVPHPLPSFREQTVIKRENLAVGLGLYGLRSLRFVGREHERARLWELLGATVADGHPRAVVLQGPAGVGKSRLAAWLIQRTHEVGIATTFRATHAPLPDPLDGLAGMLARALRVWNGDRSTVLAALKDELAPRGLRDPGVHAALASLLVPDGDGPEIPGRRRHALLTRAIATLAAPRPAVIWLDDVQWGHDAVDFADHLLTSSQAPPALIVLTARDDLLATEPEAAAAVDDLLEHARAERLVLPPLDRRASLELIEQGLHLAPALARRLHDRIHGNPMFAVELVGDWVERRLLVPTPEGFELKGTTVLRTPDSVGAVWQGKLQQLFEGFERPLAIAAVLGMEIDHDEWMRACAAAGVEVRGNFWGRLEDLRLVRRDPEVLRYTFVHGTLRDVILDRAELDGILPELHRAVAEAVEDDGRRGTHLLRAGEIERGVALLYEAAERAVGTDMRAAQRLLQIRDDALAERDPKHPGRIDGWLLASRVAAARLQPVEALRWAEKALALARHHQDRAAVVRSLQSICSARRMLGEIDAARRAIENALHLSNGLPPSLRAETLYQRAAVMLDSGEIESAERTARRVMELDDDPRRLMRAGPLLGYTLAIQGEVEEARATLEELLPLAERTGDRAAHADLLNALGEVERLQGRDREAEARYREALALIAGTGIVVPACRANLAQTLLARGEVEEARVMLRRVRDEAYEIGARMLILVAHAGLAACAADRREWDELDTHLTALEKDPGGLATEDIVTWLRYAGTYATLMGKTTLGQRALRVAVAQLRRLGRDEDAADLEELLAAPS